MEINYNNKKQYNNANTQNNTNNSNSNSSAKPYYQGTSRKKVSYNNRSPNQQLSPSNSYQQQHGSYLNDQIISFGNYNFNNKKSRFNNYNNNSYYNSNYKPKYKYNNNYYSKRNNNRYYNGFSSFNQKDNKSIDYSTLPNVVLTKIYSYLNMNDRLNASATCKNWRMGLFNPCLWHDIDLVIYLTNRHQDIKSAYFKSNNLAKYTKYVTIKYDPNDLVLLEHVSKLLDNLNNNQMITMNSNNYIHLKCISLQPVFNFSNYDDYDDYSNQDQFYFENSDNRDLADFSNFSKLNISIFKSLKQLCLNSRCIEHFSLGLLNDLNRSQDNVNELIVNLTKKHLFNLKSLHLSSINNSSIITLMESITTNCKTVANSSNSNSSIDKINDNISNNSSRFYISNLLCQFINLNTLSINYSDLSLEFLNSTVSLISLKKLNLNVNNLNENTQYDNRITNETWSHVKQRNPSLKVTVNFLNLEESSNDKLKLVLNSNMPLKILRMYFCKSLNPQLIQYISDSYCDTLESLVVVDAITDPTLRYHNPLRYDADPDPLVLLCWKCRYLQELVIVGYEILEINLIAIAKLRTNLKTFYVPMDCIIDLRYGKFKNDDFIEDEDGEDTIVDYGFCSEQVIHKVCKILGHQDWHPLERDELPMCVYDYEMPYEEAYLDTLINDQLYN